jgi:hypothetical protein
MFDIQEGERIMKSCFVTFALAGLALQGCGSTSEGTAPPAEQGHALHFVANLKEQGGELSFLTPTVAVIKVPAGDVVGKPYMVASFPAGFSPGNDPAIHSTWGSVPSDFVIRYTTPKTYKDGPYDMVLVVYTNTPITDAIKAAPVQYAPPAKNGDLATFTVDMGAVRPNEPGIPAGLVRLNVEGADADVTVENKSTLDPAELLGALTNTVMIIP